MALVGTVCGVAVVACRGPQRPPAPTGGSATSEDASTPSPTPAAEPTVDAWASDSGSKGTSHAAPSKGFSVYALSRGKGVPAAARNALRQVREAVEADRSRGVGVRVETSRLGLEGEARVCAEYDDPEDARLALDRARALVKGIDLVDLVVEPCGKPDPEEEEGKP
jgi:hypothetical protein